MNNNTKHVITSSVHLLITITRNLHKSHYEKLNLPRTCTAKEIRQSYIELSKKYHPDSNNETKSHKKFVEVTEAYQVLSKPALRRDYDLGLPSLNKENPVSYTEPEEPVEIKRNPWNDAAFWMNRDKSRDQFYSSQPYYGIKGIKRVSNWHIVLLCLGFTCIGVTLQVLAVRYSFTLRRDKMLQASDSAEANLRSVREQVARNGNQLQIEIVRRRLKNAGYDDGKD